MNSQDYIAQLKLKIESAHGCSATWRQSVPVHELLDGKTAWEGYVEVFDLIGHPKATTSYGWFSGEPEEFITVLESPPVSDAESAVKMNIARQTNPEIAQVAVPVSNDRQLASEAD
jgi:hypothetical protein